MRASWFFSVLALQALTLVGLLGVFWLLRQECLSAEGHNLTCLWQGSAIVNAVVKFGYIITKESSRYFLFSICAGLVFLFLLFVAGIRSTPMGAYRWLYFAAIALAMGGELMALRRDAWSTLYYHLAAVTCGALAAIVSSPRRNQDSDNTASDWITFDGSKTKPTIGEYVVVFLIFTTLAALRFYALNRNPMGLDDETCPHRAICFSWTRILEQELGANWQQASGLSWVVLHRLFTRFAHPSLYYLDQRLLAVGISLLNCWLVFFFVRYLRGPFAAVLALVLYGFGPLDFDWARLPTLHALPLTLGLILTWVSFWAFRQPSWLRFGCVGFLIFLTKFFYPSAKALALGPLIAACAVCVWNYSNWRGHRRKLLVIPIGIVAFLSLRPILFYFWFGRVQFIAPVQSLYLHQGAGWLDIVEKYGRESFGFLYELFYGPFGPSHWTIHTTFEPFRSVSSVCVAFIALALMRLTFSPRNLYSMLCIGFLAGGALPGIAAGMADRRIGYALVFIAILTAIEIVWFFERVVMTRSRLLLFAGKVILIVGLIAALGTGQVFAMFSRKEDKPLQVILAERVRPLIQRDTFVAYMIEPRNCEFFFGIYDLLEASNGSVAYATSVGDPQRSRQMVQTPSIDPNVWFYALTPLKSQIKTVRANGTWKRVLFVFADGSVYSEVIDLLKELYPQGVAITDRYSDTQTQQYIIFDTNPDMLAGR